VTLKEKKAIEQRKLEELAEEGSTRK